MWREYNRREVLRFKALAGEEIQTRESFGGFVANSQTKQVSLWTVDVAVSEQQKFDASKQKRNLIKILVIMILMGGVGVPRLLINTQQTHNGHPTAILQFRTWTLMAPVSREHNITEVG